MLGLSHKWEDAGRGCSKMECEEIFRTKREVEKRENYTVESFIILLLIKYYWGDQMKRVWVAEIRNGHRALVRKHERKSPLRKIWLRWNVTLKRAEDVGEDLVGEVRWRVGRGGRKQKYWKGKISWFSGKTCASQTSRRCFVKTYRGFPERFPGQNINNVKGEVIAIWGRIWQHSVTYRPAILTSPNLHLGSYECNFGNGATK